MCCYEKVRSDSHFYIQFKLTNTHHNYVLSIYVAPGEGASSYREQEFKNLPETLDEGIEKQTAVTSAMTMSWHFLMNFPSALTIVCKNFMYWTFRPWVSMQ